MSWLNAIPEADRAEIRKNLFASPEFFEAVKSSVYSGLEPLILPTLRAEWNAAFERHGFKQPHSATSVTHNIMAENTERDRHAARMLALSNLIVQAKQVTNWLGICGAPAEGARHRNSLDLAIAAVEREFKP